MWPWEQLKWKENAQKNPWKSQQPENTCFPSIVVIAKSAIQVSGGWRRGSPRSNETVFRFISSRLSEGDEHHDDLLSITWSSKEFRWQFGQKTFSSWIPSWRRVLQIRLARALYVFQGAETILNTANFAWRRSLTYPKLHFGHKWLCRPLNAESHLLFVLSYDADERVVTLNSFNEHHPAENREILISRRWWQLCILRTTLLHGSHGFITLHDITSASHDITQQHS